MKNRQARFHCKTEAQKRAIKICYAKRNDSKQGKVGIEKKQVPTLRQIPVLKQNLEQKPLSSQNNEVVESTPKRVFPEKFPFWARLKIGKNRTTLVIDEELVKNKKNNEMEPGFVHREAIHSHGDGSNVKGYEKIEPNPDPADEEPMYLKSPAKLPKILFKPHNKELNMPEHLRKRYESNNNKKEQ